MIEPKFKVGDKVIFHSPVKNRSPHLQTVTVVENGVWENVITTYDIRRKTGHYFYIIKVFSASARKEVITYAWQHELTAA